MIPLFSAAAAHEGLDLRAPLLRVLDRQWFVLGEEVLSFEGEFAAWCGVPHAVGLANGTEALELALRAVGVRAGDEVLCAANAGFYGSTATLALGALPRYAEVSDDTLTLDPAAVRAHLADRRPAAVIVTHLHGQLADMAALVPLCREAGVPLVEDCAQAHGARRDGRRAGAFADIGCFSFYPTKNLGALGDGGAIVTARDDLAAVVRSLRQYGWGAKYHVIRDGGRNSRLDELQAAVLRAKLPHLDRQNEERRVIARRYNAAFADLPLRLPRVDESHAMHLYVVRCAERDALRRHLQAAGVGSEVHYPVPDHRQAVQAAGLPALPVTETACDHVLSLPCFPGLTPQQAEVVIAAVRGFFSARA